MLGWVVTIFSEWAGFERFVLRDLFWFGVVVYQVSTSVPYFGLALAQA